MTIINAEAPIALHVETYANGRTIICPLTPCCTASAKGSMDAVVCRACYEEIHSSFGDCWAPDEQRGWDTYLILVAGELQAQRFAATGRMGGDTVLEDRARATEVVAEAKRQLAEGTAI